MGFEIEYEGDDTEVLHFALRRVARMRGTAEVMLDGRTIPSVADYLVSDVTTNRVTLTLVDQGTGKYVVRPNGSLDVRVVDIDDIMQIKIY